MPGENFGFSVGDTTSFPSTYHVVTDRREQPSLDGSAAESAIESWLASRLGLNTMYQVVHDWAKLEFGVGGTLDLGEFLLRSMTLFEERSPRLEFAAATGDEFGDAPVLPPICSVFWQQCPELGDDAVVVNNSGGLGLGATFRWGGSLASHGSDVVAQISDRTGLDVLPFTFADEWNGIQTGGGHVATWPAGRFHRASDLDLTGMTVHVHDEAITITRNGMTVVPLYTGAMPEHRMTGAVRVFSLIGHPWAFDVARRQPVGPSWDREVHEESLVTQRRGSEIERQQIVAWSKLELHRAMLEMGTWADAAGLPRSCFWKASGGSKSLRASTRKPAYLDFASPHLVAAFLQTASSHDAVIVEEAMPNSRETTDQVEEYVSLFVLDRKGTSK